MTTIVDNFIFFKLIILSSPILFIKPTIFI